MILVLAGLYIGAQGVALSTWNGDPRILWIHISPTWILLLGALLYSLRGK